MRTDSGIVSSWGVILRMNGNTHEGFRFGAWQAFPTRNLLLGPPGEIHIEPKVMQVLEYLASHPGQVVNRDTLLHDIWEGRAFSDEPLSRCIFELRHALGDSAKDPKYIETIPKSGYRLTCTVESLGQATGRRRIALAAFLGLILIAAVYVAYRSTLTNPIESPQLTAEGATKSAPPVYSIAVLPFVNMSADPEQEYFSDGITEEILNGLTAFRGLRVISRTSSFSFKETDVPIPEVAEALGVANILEGSVRKSGNRVRITANLIDAGNDRQLWSGSYERELGDIFMIQDEISAAIVAALEEHLGLQFEAAPRGIATVRTEAHDAYLRGMFLGQKNDRVAFEGAVREFEKAIALDPDYALAHAALAGTILSLRRNRSGNLTNAVAIARAAPHAERAMTLDPGLAEAHAATGSVLLIQNNPEEALTYYRQAIKINPNYDVPYNAMGVILFERLGQYKEAFAMEEMALQLNPMDSALKYNRIMSLIALNRLAEADRELEKYAYPPDRHARLRGYLTALGGKWANGALAHLDSLQIQPVSFVSRRLLSAHFTTLGLEKEALAICQTPNPYVLSWLGRAEDTVAAAEMRLAEDPDDLYAHTHLGLALTNAGDYTGARPFLEEMWQRSGGRITRFGVFHTANAAALIAIRRDAGEEAEVGELVAAMRDDVRRYREAGVIRVYSFYHSVDYEEGLVEYLAGEREKGLALIARAVEDGFFIPPNQAYLQVLYDDPGFAPIRASQEARRDRERERFLDIVCTDNPYLSVWQPAEGTCEQFAALGRN